MLPARITPLLMLLQAFVPVLIVDLAGAGVRERFVGLGDLDEFGMGG